MLHRALIAASMVLLVAGSPVAAQDSRADPDQRLVTNDERPTTSHQRPTTTDQRPPPALRPLYVSMIGLHALDAHSTHRALNAGGSESNPLVRGLVESPIGVVAVKAGSSAVVIYAAEKMWKHNRVAAVIMIVGINTAYAAIVAHNYATGNK